MRAFIALDIPKQMHTELAYLAQQLSKTIDGRFMKSDSYHITLAFLGEIDEATVQSCIKLLDSLAASHEKINLYPEGLGKFGRAQDATLILELQKSDELMQLTQDLRNGLQEQKIAFDNKRFRPHITLARRANIPKNDLLSLRFPHPAQASTITLYKSTLMPQGAFYKPIHQVGLTESARLS